MLLEHVPSKLRWVLHFNAEDHLQLFEKGKDGAVFAPPVLAWLNTQLPTASVTITRSNLRETKVEIAFLQKSDADHYMARFFHG